jgi:hypothetical protein
MCIPTLENENWTGLGGGGGNAVAQLAEALRQEVACLTSDGFIRIFY